MEPEHSAAANDNEFDPVIAVVLAQLWTSASENRDKPWSLAKLSKRADLPMSTLRRTLARLKSTGLADFSIDEEGRGSAAFTQQGLEFYSSLHKSTLLMHSKIRFARNPQYCYKAFSLVQCSNPAILNSKPH